VNPPQFRSRTLPHAVGVRRRGESEAPPRRRSELRRTAFDKGKGDLSSGSDSDPGKTDSGLSGAPPNRDPPPAVPNRIEAPPLRAVPDFHMSKMFHAVRSVIPILKYRLLLAGKECFSALSRRVNDAPANHPSLTIFVASWNTRDALALTLESMVRNTGLVNVRIVVGENNSSDGTREYLEGWRGPIPLEVRHNPVPRRHQEWLNEIAATVETNYWVAVDSDVLFLGQDWLAAMLHRMESDSNLQLLSVRREKRQDIRAIAGRPAMCVHSRPAAWLMMVRTALRDRVKPDFTGVGITTPDGSLHEVWDVGGRLEREIVQAGMRVDVMPRWFRMWVHHYENLSYALLEGSADSVYQTFKRHQLADIRCRLANGRRFG